jgi:hypothetical protein
MSTGKNTPVEIATLLLRFEQSLLDPAVRRETAQVSALLAHDFVEFGASGTKWTREQIIDLLAREDFDPPTIENFECRLIAEGVILVTYRAVRAEPKARSRSVSLRSSLWTNESGVWLLRFHQGTRAN